MISNVHGLVELNAVEMACVIRQQEDVIARRGGLVLLVVFSVVATWNTVIVILHFVMRQLERLLGLVLSAPVMEISLVFARIAKMELKVLHVPLLVSMEELQVKFVFVINIGVQLLAMFHVQEVERRRRHQRHHLHLPLLQIHHHLHQRLLLELSVLVMVSVTGVEKSLETATATTGGTAQLATSNAQPQFACVVDSVTLNAMLKERANA